MNNIEERISKLEETIQTLNKSVERLQNGEFELLRISKGLFVFDDESRPRIFLSVDSSGDPFISILNPEGKSNIRIGSNEGSSEICLSDTDGNPRLKLCVSEESNPIAMFLGTNREPQLTLSVQNDQPFVLLHDADGAMRVGASLEPWPNIQIYDKDAKPRINLSLNGDEADVCIIDTNDNIRDL